jgi:hypothetical protein
MYCRTHRSSRADEDGGWTGQTAGYDRTRCVRRDTNHLAWPSKEDRTGRMLEQSPFLPAGILRPKSFTVSHFVREFESAASRASSRDIGWKAGCAEKAGYSLGLGCLNSNGSILLTPTQPSS